MSPRLRKFVGMLAILAFLFVYVIVAVTVGERLPSHWAAQLVFYALAGILWWVPLAPLIRWMERRG
ncbi:MAG: DUF2842 domain-containing protein [Phenylobacterium sp.]|uniref:DUF2842 domain-containing protein n=1 Tax=Phenylobacterium sp. TaxID=1871053 RepID=UPI001A45AA60|nr:DUF2842 domain-containing protein [Phenylobacterium sp.]MBL8770459.1 DUF2842 domain-containing protein [Phenylobacterium sp.]